MKLKDLTKAQSDAAHAAAKCIIEGDLECMCDRLAYRQAKADLAALLPDDVNARDVIGEAIRRRMLDRITKVVDLGIGTLIVFGDDND
jgi:hypothetical protein